MPLSIKIVLLVAYILSIWSTVYLWDEERRRDLFKAFMPVWQLELNMYTFRFITPIMLLVTGLLLFSLFSESGR